MVRNSSWWWMKMVTNGWLDDGVGRSGALRPNANRIFGDPRPYDVLVWCPGPVPCMKVHHHWESWGVWRTSSCPCQRQQQTSDRCETVGVKSIFLGLSCSVSWTSFVVGNASGLRSRVDTDLGMEWGVEDTEALLSAMLNVSLLRRNPDCRDAWATKFRKQKPALEFQFCSENGKDGWKHDDWSSSRTWVNLN